MNPAEMYLRDVEELRSQLSGWSLLQRRRFLRRNGFPMFLYKYMNPNRPSGLDYIENIVIRSRLYLSSPVEFNDPFDTRLAMQLRGTPAERRGGLQRMAKRVFPNADRKEREAWVRRSMLQSATKDPFAGELSTLPAGIHSFSETGRSILAWGHYADSHRGLCLIFEPSQSLMPLMHTIPVRYQAGFTTINFATASNAAIEDAYERSIVTKAPDWAYEKEHRLIFVGKAGQHLPFDARALFGVIFGITSSAETIESIMGMDNQRITKGLRPLKKFKARSSSSSYAIRLSRFDPLPP